MSGEILIRRVTKNRGGECLRDRDLVREQGELPQGRRTGAVRHGAVSRCAAHGRDRLITVRICVSSPAVHRRDRQVIVRICVSSPAVHQRGRQVTVRICVSGPAVHRRGRQVTVRICVSGLAAHRDRCTEAKPLGAASQCAEHQNCSPCAGSRRAELTAAGRSR